LVGQQLCRKYSLKVRRAMELLHPTQASLCATAMRDGGIREFRRQVSMHPRLVDVGLWRWTGHKKLYDGCHVVGMKCLPGRGGIDSGHRDNFGDIEDPDFELLREWLGSAADAYIAIVNRMEQEQASSRDEEIAQYVKAYSKPDYRMGSRRRADVQKLMRSLPQGSLLDVATGRGESLRFAEEAGHGPVHGTEVVPSLLGPQVTYAQAHQIPFEDASFDHVTCFDCLEHLTEPDIKPALSEMFRVARKTCTVSVSEVSDIRNGRELHISKRPRQEWERLIKSVWGVKARWVGFAGRSPMYQVVKDG
jgi:hypothetical protein